MSSPVGAEVAMICDAGPALGVGHVMRCLALAEELIGRGMAVTMLADLDRCGDLGWAAEAVVRRGIELRAEPADPATARRLVAETSPSVVVVDSYRLPPSTYAELRAPGRRLLAVVDGDDGGDDGDGGPARRAADVYLDQNLGAEAEDRPRPAGSIRLAGLDYVLLRDDVRRHRPAVPPAEVGTPPRVLAFFGGTDAAGVAPPVTRLVAATGVPCELTVVVARPELSAAAEEVVPAPGQRIELTGPVDDLAARVARADVVISAAGTSSWELLALGAAVAFVRVADNQRIGYRRLLDAGLGVGLGTPAELSGPAACAALAGLLTDPGRRTALRRAGWRAVDGDGRVRVADALVGVPDRRPVPGPASASAGSRR
ncbi:MAG: spore coat protein [Nocardioides sp.]|uniref:PseG/SpsG family protein n=1 Tax=Nocardioides sp. TaxID=35761 RepID=UPI0039E2F715